MNTTGKLTLLKNLDPEIVKLDLELFPRPWKAQDWTELNFNHHLLYSWRTGDGLVSFALFQWIPGDETAHLLQIITKPEHRYTGQTQEFWAQMLQNLKAHKVQNIFLEVESKNLRAIRFYKKSGFQTLRSVAGFYSDGMDALLMQLMLGETRV